MKLITNKYYLIIALILLMFTITLAQQADLDYERWGTFGVGKLVTKISNTNNIGSGRLAFPARAKFPAFEYPYNPNESGRHVYYAVGVSFHIGGISNDKGYYPAGLYERGEISLADYQLELDLYDTQSGDQAVYKYYKGFNFDGFPVFNAPSSLDPIPTSDNTGGWPTIWPEYLPTSTPVQDIYAPDYPTAYTSGFADPIPLYFDEISGFPGAGPNKYTPEGFYKPGQVVADQESFTVSFAKGHPEDQDHGNLQLITTLRGLSWKGDIGEDFLYWIFTFTNIGTEDIRDTYTGMFADYDFPWSSSQAYDSYSLTDSYALDTYDIDEETGEEYLIAYGWDGDGDVPGAYQGIWPYNKAKMVDGTPLDDVALAGIIFLQTPFDTLHTGELGMTTFDAFKIDNKGLIDGIGNTRAKFYTLNIVNENDPDDADGDGFDDWNWDFPYPGVHENYLNGYRGAMAMSTGAFILKPGETDTLVVATVMGVSRSDLFKNAKFAKQIFEAGWIVPKPPMDPIVQTTIESGKITLNWGNLSQKDDLNSMMGRESFEGFKIYRSSDGGASWGELPITDENGTIIDYVPKGQYDLINGITGSSPVSPWFNRGTDSGLDAITIPLKEVRDVEIPALSMTVQDSIIYEFIDETVLDGFTYTYAIIAYSAGAITVDGLQPLQSPRTSGTNVVTVIPFGLGAETENDLDKIKVVPNPYRVFNIQETSLREKMIKFTHLPPVCTIRIFNLSGELIATLEHNEMSSTYSEEPWNLRSSENREVAPGVYFYHLSSALGEKTGKFVLIK